MFFKKEEHIIIILQRLNAGGAERQVSYLARYLQSVQKKVTVLYFGSTKGKASEWFEKFNITCLPFGFNEKLIVGEKKAFAERIRKYYFSIRFVLLVRRQRPTVLLPFTYEPNIITGVLWKFTGANRCIWNQRDGGLYFKGTATELKALKNCSGWITNSTSGAMFLQQYAVPHIKIIPNGIELPEKNRQPKSTAKLRVVMVANIHSNKDHATLLKAWALTVKEIGEENAELFLAGSFGDRYEMVKQLINEYQLQASVVLNGAVEDMQALLQTCDIGVLSSKLEGLPNGILECMSMGLPVVATDNAGARDALGADAPFLSVVEDAQIMAQHLIRLLQSATLREETGKKNRKRIEEHFSISRMGDAFCKEISFHTNGSSTR